MRDDEIRRLLTDANPWWRAAASGTDPLAWTRDHRLLRDRARHDLGFRATVLDDVGAEPVTDQLVVLTGPRRVGKSVTLLDLAATLCARADVGPWRVLLVPCDAMSERDLRRTLTLARELTRPAEVSGARARVWLLDEVSGVPGWSAVLKAARDGTAFGDDTVVATGSRWAASEDIEGNLMAGRAGSGAGRRRRQLLPMTFRDYLAAARPELARPGPARIDQLQDRAVAIRLQQVQFDVDAYDLAWQAYLTCGGFPRAVSEHTHHGQVSAPYLRDLAAWLRRDVDVDAAPESLPLLLDGLWRRAPSPMSVARTAADLAYPSRDVFDLRLRRLIATRAALWCSRRDPAGRVVAGSQSKLYLIDPVLAWLPSRLRAGLDEPDMTVLTEMAIGVAAARAIEDLDEGRWVAGDTIGYARTSGDHEVDLAPVPVPTAAGARISVPMESKWVDHGWRAAARTIDGKYHAGILATKSVLDTRGDVWAVPAPLVALLLS